jgi:glycine C-acetyltransferase
MYSKIKHHLENTLNEIREAGLYKSERVIDEPQDAQIEVGRSEVLNMCSNNYTIALRFSAYLTIE